MHARAVLPIFEAFESISRTSVFAASEHSPRRGRYQISITAMFNFASVTDRKSLEIFDSEETLPEFRRV